MIVSIFLDVLLLLAWLPFPWWLGERLLWLVMVLWLLRLWLQSYRWQIDDNMWMALLLLLLGLRLLWLLFRRGEHSNELNESVRTLEPFIAAEVLLNRFHSIFSIRDWLWLLLLLVLVRLQFLLQVLYNVRDALGRFLKDLSFVMVLSLWLLHAIFEQRLLCFELSDFSLLLGDGSLPLDVFNDVICLRCIGWRRWLRLRCRWRLWSRDVN